jgi:hypothetical protein
MTRMKIQTLLATAALTVPLAALAEGDSPWLPIPGEFSLGLNYTQQSGDESWIGSTRLSLTDITGGGASKYKRSSTQVRLGYGFSDAVALDATLGYGKVEVGAADSDSGLLDTVIGVNWRVLDEFEQPSLPTLTLRAAAILKGDYEGARLAALGNDENGFELAVVLGKQFTSALGVWAEVGAQDRSGDVPGAIFYELGARYRFAPGWSASLGYSDKKYRGSLDIGGPGFDPTRFQQVRAERGVAKLGIGYGFAGNQGVALNLAKTVSGRNTVKDDQIIGLSYTYAF